MIGDSNDKSNFPHEILLTNRQVSNICKAFANNSSVDIKFSKAQLSQIIQSGGFLGKLLSAILKTGLPLMKSVIKPLAKWVLIPLGLTAAASAANEDFGLLLKGVTESVQNETKEQKGGFLSMLLGTLGASLLGYLLTGKGVFHARKEVNK